MDGSDRGGAEERRVSPSELLPDRPTLSPPRNGYRSDSINQVFMFGTE